MVHQIVTQTSILTKIWKRIVSLLHFPECLHFKENDFKKNAFRILVRMHGKEL